MIERLLGIERKAPKQKLAANLGQVAVRAEQLGIRIGIMCTDKGDVIYEKNPDEHFNQGSIYKLGVANALHQVRSINPEFAGKQVSYKVDRVSKEGGAGKYDTGKTWQQETVAGLTQDMLQRSGNTSALHLVDELGGPEVVNAMLEADGFEATSLDPIPDSDETPGEGKFLSGSTTPREALMLMHRVSALESDYDSMLSSTFEGGVRRYTASREVREDRVEVATKHGSLFVGGPPGYQGTFNEVALFAGGDVDLGVFTDFVEPKKLRAHAKRWAQKEAVRQAGAAVAEYSGVAVTPLWGLGSLALVAASAASPASFQNLRL